MRVLPGRALPQLGDTADEGSGATVTEVSPMHNRTRRRKWKRMASEERAPGPPEDGIAHSEHRPWADSYKPAGDLDVDLASG